MKLKFKCKISRAAQKLGQKWATIVQRVPGLIPSPSEPVDQYFQKHTCQILPISAKSNSDLWDSTPFPSYLYWVTEEAQRKYVVRQKGDVGRKFVAEIKHAEMIQHFKCIPVNEGDKPDRGV